MISNKDGLEHLANIFIKKGITDIVISPGSRNAPMMLTFPEYESFNIYSIIDERSAGFFALGLAQNTRKPVILNCTSGSALLNYAPAVAEAFYQNIPLIILSADRPARLIDQGDGQTIQQQNVYDNFIRKSVHLPEIIPSLEESKTYQNLVFEAIEACQQPLCGPVHINVPLDEPIYGLQEKNQVKLIDYLPKLKTQQTETHHLEGLKTQWHSAAKKMIIVGQHLPNNKLKETLEQLSKEEDVVILSETTSNVYSSAFISKIDQSLSQINSENENDFYPDLLISLGRHIVSKKIKAWLRKAETLCHWHISYNLQAPDTFYHLKEHIKAEESDFLESLLSKETSSKKYQASWTKIANRANKLHEQIMQNLPYSDLMVFRDLFETAPSNIQLHFANSTPIRYSQFFSFGKQQIINSNRGVSGIDGSVSTALGQSINFQGKTILITGDLSFFYDSNALWNKYLHSNFKVLLINNGGGGIFRFIDGPLKSGKIDLFETPHTRTAQSLATEAGMHYSSCNSASNLKEKLDLFIQSSSAQLLEVFTPRTINDQVLKDYFISLRTNS